MADLELTLSEHGPIAKISIGPPFLSAGYRKPIILTALVRTNLTRSVIDRAVLEAAESVWKRGGNAFDDPGDSTEDQDRDDLGDIASLGVPVDYRTNPIRQCTVCYSFDTGQQSIGTSAKQRLRSILALDLRAIEPIRFIIGQDILDRERHDTSEQERIQRLLGD